MTKKTSVMKSTHFKKSLSEEENQAELLKDVLKATIELNNIIVTLKNNLENLNNEIIKLISNIINKNTPVLYNGICILI